MQVGTTCDDRGYSRITCAWSDIFPFGKYLLEKNTQIGHGRVLFGATGRQFKCQHIYSMDHDTRFIYMYEHLKQRFVIICLDVYTIHISRIWM